MFVTDDREEFANAERFPEADIIVAENPETALPQLPINANTFIIIATRGHRYDNVALEAAALTPAKYVGLLGSKRKTILIYEDLIRSGLPIERIREIRSPVGLDVRGRTPEEIAVSIMAEVLMFRLGGTGQPMKIEDWRIDRIREKVEAGKRRGCGRRLGYRPEECDCVSWTTPRPSPSSLESVVASPVSAACASRSMTSWNTWRRE